MSSDFDEFTEEFTEECRGGLEGKYVVDLKENKFNSVENFTLKLTEKLIELPGDIRIKEYKRLIRVAINDDKSRKYQQACDQYSAAINEGEYLLTKFDANGQIPGKNAIAIVQVSLKSRQAYLTNLIFIYGLNNQLTNISPHSNVDT